jgi:hypothetical protein
VDNYMDNCRFDISTSTVLDGGQTICVSSSEYQFEYRSESEVTLCFDMATREWWRSGDWRLPFQGTVEYVPELGTWLGFSPDHPHHLCAADLSGVASAGPRAEEPTLQHVWEDFNPPSDKETSIVLNKRFPGILHTTKMSWTASQLHLVNLVSVPLLPSTLQGKLGLGGHLGPTFLMFVFLARSGTGPTNLCCVREPASSGEISSKTKRERDKHFV